MSSYNTSFLLTCVQQVNMLVDDPQIFEYNEQLFYSCYVEFNYVVIEIYTEDDGAILIRRFAGDALVAHKLKNYFYHYLYHVPIFEPPCLEWVGDADYNSLTELLCLGDRQLAGEIIISLCNDIRAGRRGVTTYCRNNISLEMLEQVQYGDDYGLAYRYISQFVS